MSAEQPTNQPPSLGGNSYDGGYSSRGFKCDEVGNRSQCGRTAEGTILEIRLTLQMVVMVCRSAADVGRTELHQERGATRGHEAHWDIGTKDQRGQQYDGQHIGSPSVTEPSFHDCGRHHARVSAIVPVQAPWKRRRVSDIKAAHEELLRRGIQVSDMWHGAPFPPEARLPGPDPKRASYVSFFAFGDPDGNAWLAKRSQRGAPAASAVASTERAAAWRLWPQSHAAREQVAMRRYPEGLLERSREMGLGDSAHSCQPLHWPVLVRGGVHSVLRAQQATQQLGFLVHCDGNHRPVSGAVE